MLVSGGYYIGQRTYLKGISSSPSSTILSCSRCLIDLLPEIWPRDHSGSTEESLIKNARQLAPKFGTPAIDTLTNLIQAGRFGYPSTFLDLAGAISFFDEARLEGDVMVVFGIGLASEYLDKFLGDIAPNEECCGIPFATRQHQLLEAGYALGWELLGYEGASFHSWLCNQLDVQAIALGRRLEPGILLPDYVTATAVADFCNSPAAHGEPVRWLPWQLVEYRRHPRGDANNRMRPTAALLASAGESSEPTMRSHKLVPS